MAVIQFMKRRFIDVESNKSKALWSKYVHRCYFKGRRNSSIPSRSLQKRKEIDDSVSQAALIEAAKEI